MRRSYFEALLARADAHLGRYQLDDARTALDRALEIHPDYVDARALHARACLIQARRQETMEPLDDGRAHAARAIEIDPHHYDATVTLAEIEIETGRRTGRDGPMVAALETLARAATCEGCQNRVSLLSATAQLELARLARTRGGDPRGQLGEVLSLAERGLSAVADNGPWTAIRQAAEQELASL